MTETITIRSQQFVLHPLGGVFWKKKSMLLISDVHLGKVSHFRKFGAAVPQKAIHKNFLLLDKIVTEFKPFHLCFLGDLFHSSLNKEWDIFANWAAKTPTKISLVIGNHDIIAPEKFNALGVEIFSKLQLDDFVLTHHPEEHQDKFNFCGHIHPAVKLQGFGRQRLKLPCFFRTKNQLILPAFGEFTGNHTLKPKKEDEVFVLVDGEVIKI